MSKTDSYYVQQTVSKEYLLCFPNLLWAILADLAFYGNQVWRNPKEAMWFCGEDKYGYCYTITGVADI